MSAASAGIDATGDRARLRREVRLWVLQRASAALLAVLALAHIAVMIWAVRGGLSGSEILGRTRGSVGALAFYGLFALVASVHAGIGVRGIAREWLPVSDRAAGAIGVLVALALAAAGVRAAWGLYA